jgi:flavin reductase (DIM6/NTAB) family NADH-FMN oxidoreductase RutF
VKPKRKHTLSFAKPDALHMRRTMSRLLTGVAVVTTKADDELHGMTINSLTSISFDVTDSDDLPELRSELI